MPGTRQRRGRTNQRPAGISTCLRILTVLLAWLPAASAAAVNGSQSTTGVDGREAIQAAAALGQQGKLVEADSQAQRALADPETRAVGA
jgi:hypothetical protein